MKMTDYPCLYRLADADISAQCDLFCSLSSIFGLNPSEIVEHSELFAHTSQGILFDGKGLTLKDIESFGKKRLDKPFADCKSLSSAFSVYDLKNEACKICRLSTIYKNRWLKDEQMLLSFILQKGKNYDELICDLQEKNFCSVCFLVPGKSLRAYPLVPFNRHLLAYIKSLPDFGSLDRDEIANGFAPYLHDAVRETQKEKKIVDAADPAPVSISFVNITDCISREFAVLYGYSMNTLTDTQILKCKTRNRDVLNTTYTPPAIKHGIANGSSTDTDSILSSVDNEGCRKRSKGQNSPAAGTLFQINIFDSIPDSAPSAVSLPADTFTQLSAAKNASEPVSPAKTSAPSGSMISDSLLKNGQNAEAGKQNNSDKDTHGNIVPTTQLPLVGTDAPANGIANTESCHDRDNSSFAVFDISSADEVYNACFMNTCGLLFPQYNLEDSFFDSIIDCSINDIHNIHLFLTDSCSSATICLEAMRFHMRTGLLFYMECSGRFFFFDIEFSYSNFLQPILGKASKIQYLSMNSIPVYYMLSMLGFQHVYIEMLPTLFSCVEEISYNVPLPVLVTTTLHAEKEESMGFYQFAMPHYHEIYGLLIKKSGTLDNPSAALADYRSMNYFNRALASAFNLSDVVLDLNPGVTGINRHNYFLQYDKDMQIVSTGILYLLKFSLMGDVAEDAKYRLYHAIISSVYSLPYNCLLYARLLSVSPDSLAFFCTANGDQFFDILLDCARRAYQDTFFKIPVIDTERIVY